MACHLALGRERPLAQTTAHILDQSFARFHDQSSTTINNGDYFLREQDLTSLRE
ncbi:MAG: hypothetical protein KC418_23080 [Anaerolineales bacterium]|nr:hypothetical protein [Anaerolineales bacterium]MCB8954490.1 hypothetical protein [Ardenticatenales bacterium]